MKDDYNYTETPYSREMEGQNEPATIVTDCVRCGASFNVPANEWDGRDHTCPDCTDARVDEDDERGPRGLR